MDIIRKVFVLVQAQGLAFTDKRWRFCVLGSIMNQSNSTSTHVTPSAN